MATIKPLLAKILIQVGADEPKEIGTIEIPIEVSVAGQSKHGAITFNIDSSADPVEVAHAVSRRLAAHGSI
jgi:hypothetical protein